MKKLVMVLVAGCVTLAAYPCYRQPIILKAVTGSARALSPPTSATIKIDGEVQPSARCFAVRSRFDGAPADILVLWLPDPYAVYGREVIIVDRLHNDAGLPNAGNRDYYLLWDRYLFQSESGSLYASFSGPKFESQATQLEVREGYIKFVVPQSPVLAGKRIEVIFDSSRAA